MGRIDQPVENSTDTPPDDDYSLTRRDLFGLSWRVLAAFAAGQAACIGLRFLASREVEGSVGEIVTAGLLSDFPPGTITPFEQARFFLVRFEDGGFLALHSKCTHLACIVGWDEAQQRFICPCHGSEFERDGNVLNPPAPQPLDRFPITFDNNRVRVDTGHAIRRNGASADDLAYAPEPEPTPEVPVEISPGFQPLDL